MSADTNAAITPLTSTELPECARLFVATFNTPPWNESWSVQDAQQRLGDFLDTPRSVGVCLAEPDSADNQLIGFALGHLERSSTGDHFLLQEMCVRPDRQRQGHGTTLIRALEQRIPEVTHWYLLTTHNSAAANFYQRCSFRPAGRMGVFVRP